jgi:prolipoprotein diacylglyceryl transferase
MLTTALVAGPARGALLVPAAIPSPSFNQLGPLRMYALAIIAGVFAGVWLARRRWAARGGDPEDMVDIAFWAVPAGLIGARLYHVITDWKTYFGSAPDGTWNPVGALEIWKGGLGIPGGIIVGVGVGVFVASRKGIRLGPGLDAVAPALPLAQAIGRLGNWFNQEVFGRPTDLPWGLQIDPQFRPRQYAAFATFHPTFLYEALWNLGLVAVLLLIDRRRALRPGRLFVLYVGGYGLGRLWVESLRSDNASLILGLRVNIWMSLLMIVGAAGFLVVGGLFRRSDDIDAPYRDGAGPDAEGGEADAEGDDAEVEAGESSPDPVPPDPVPPDPVPPDPVPPAQ